MSQALHVQGSTGCDNSDSTSHSMIWSRDFCICKPHTD